MHQPMPTLLLAVATAPMAERRAQADRERFLRRAQTDPRPKLIALPSRPMTGRVIPLFSQIPPAPEAA